MLKKNKVIIQSFFLLCITSFFVFYSIAISRAACENLVGKAKDDCEDKEDQAKTYEAIIKIKEQQASALQNQLNLIDIEQSKNQNEIEETHNNLQKLSEQIKKLQKDIQEKKDLIAYQEIVLSNLLQSYYEDDLQDLTGIILFGKNFSEIFNQLDYTGQISIKLSEVLDEIKNTKAELEEKENDFQSKKYDSEQEKNNLEQKNLNLQYTENKKYALLGQTQEEKEKYEKLLEDIENEIYDLESGKSVDYSNIPAAKGGYFDYPVANPKITQAYGMTSYAKAGAYGGKPHNGIDFGIKYASIFAAKEGTVVGSGDNGKYAYGKWIAIDHSDGLVTLYGHLSSKLVNKGAKVKKGEKIAISGNTGNSTGPHLHFSVFDKKTFGTTESKYVKGLMIPTGASINPKRYLK